MRVNATQEERVIATHAGYWLQGARPRDSGWQERAVASQAGYWACVCASPCVDFAAARRAVPSACASARQAVELLGLAQVQGMQPFQPRVKKTPPGMAAQTRPALAEACARMSTECSGVAMAVQQRNVR